MKKLWLVITLSISAAVPLLTGCVERRVVYVPSAPQPVVTAEAPPGPVVVTEAPPAPQTEVVITAPGPGYVWVPGYWSWQGRWVWMRGSWVLRPHPGALWVPGRWAHRRHGYFWVSGHWR